MACEVVIMWKSKKLIEQEKEIDALLSKIKPIDQFEREILSAMDNIDQANALIGSYLRCPQGISYGH